MKVSAHSLQILAEIQDLVLANRRLEHDAKALASGGELERARESLLNNSQELSAKRSALEEIQRDISRLEQDLALVEKRAATDRERLQKTAVSRDVAGLQHELETLDKRRNELEEVELNLLERRDELSNQLSELEALNEELEASLARTKLDVQGRLAELKNVHAEQTNQLKSQRNLVPEDLLQLFDQKLARGVAIGKLQKNSCGACNMSITATSLAALHAVPSDELATCPDCTAILIR